MNSFQNVLDNSKFFKYKNFLLTPRQGPALHVIVNCLPQTPPDYWTAVKLFSYYVLDDLPIKTVEVASHLHFCAVSTSVLVWAVGTPTLVGQTVFLCLIFARLHRPGKLQFGVKLLHSLFQPATKTSFLPSLESSARHLDNLQDR